MTLRFVSGDPLLTQQQTLAIGYNLRARPEVEPLTLSVERRWPAAFAAYRKQTRRGRLRAGDIWPWYEAQPRLLFWIIRETAVGATRPRFVDAAALHTARDYQLNGITSLAIAPLGRPHELESIEEALQLTLATSSLDVVVYRTYESGVFGEG